MPSINIVDSFGNVHVMSILYDKELNFMFDGINHPFDKLKDDITYTVSMEEKLGGHNGIHKD
jgi:hypothetical protein